MAINAKVSVSVRVRHGPRRGARDDEGEGRRRLDALGRERSSQGWRGNGNRCRRRQTNSRQRWVEGRMIERTGVRSWRRLGLRRKGRCRAVAMGEGSLLPRFAGTRKRDPRNLANLLSGSSRATSFRCPAMPDSLTHLQTFLSPRACVTAGLGLWGTFLAPVYVAATLTPRRLRSTSVRSMNTRRSADRATES